MTGITIREMVDNGIRWIETEWFNRNVKWFDHIDLDSFRITSFGNCIIGQLFGPDEWGFLTENLGDDWIDDHGFYSGGWDGRDADHLEAEWTNRIMDLREGK